MKKFLPSPFPAHRMFNPTTADTAKIKKKINEKSSCYNERQSSRKNIYQNKEIPGKIFLSPSLGHCMTYHIVCFKVIITNVSVTLI